MFFRLKTDEEISPDFLQLLIFLLFLFSFSEACLHYLLYLLFLRFFGQIVRISNVVCSPLLILAQVDHEHMTIILKHVIEIVSLHWLYYFHLICFSL